MRLQRKVREVHNMRRWVYSFGMVIAVLATLIPAYAQNPFTSSYQYITVHETTVFGETIKFWSEDTLWGPVHSNDKIAIMQSPVFFDTVSTSSSCFWQGSGYHPQFSIEPIFNAPRVALPDSAIAIREMAAQQGLFFISANGYYASRLCFNDNLGWTLYQWPMGTHFDSTAIIATGAPPDDRVFYIDGYLELKGIFRGTATVGATGHPDPDNYLGYHSIRLLDDIRYWFADPATGAFNDTTGGYTDMLGIVSETNITVANTWENGRENMAQGSDIIINAAIVALNESFSFEDQNEDPATATPWELWTGHYNCPSPPYNDERGDIFLYGSVAQKRRGYVHRSNHNGTGYGKKYHFDARLREQSPFLGILARHQPVLDPESLDFGGTPLNQPIVSELALYNEGGTFIDVESIALANPTFSFSVLGPQDYSEIAPGDSIIFSVSFQPAEPMTYEDTLTITLFYGDDILVPLCGTGSALGIKDNVEVPEDYEISVFPNPFNDELKIAWNFDAQTVRVAIYNIHGQQIEAVDTNGAHQSGGHYMWKPGNMTGGIYFVSVTAPQWRHVQKVIYLK
ncbi:hypothetical protein CEE37_10230 [candidate division LCP-89 bacterium B3_LCP]|uniref:Secretion system C-terminal sorting domain-containing protein n=1 Tax=candidate division LCP-89 bacterium B3_LCP TaxID=2012998 RepID=A0A532UYR4_UNCL8|nr:MAG: hypothetical protein CEE37_10230 [candidate division LCP-89 bacterium B3_LCP]